MPPSILAKNPARLLPITPPNFVRRYAEEPVMDGDYRYDASMTEPTLIVMPFRFETAGDAERFFSVGNLPTTILRRVDPRRTDYSGIVAMAVSQLRHRACPVALSLDSGQFNEAEATIIVSAAIRVATENFTRR
jgi:hypothetical protein